MFQTSSSFPRNVQTLSVLSFARVKQSGSWHICFRGGSASKWLEPFPLQRWGSWQGRDATAADFVRQPAAPFNVDLPHLAVLQFTSHTMQCRHQLHQHLLPGEQWGNPVPGRSKKRLPHRRAWGSPPPAPWTQVHLTSGARLKRPVPGSQEFQKDLLGLPMKGHLLAFLSTAGANPGPSLENGRFHSHTPDPQQAQPDQQGI